MGATEQRCTGASLPATAPRYRLLRLVGQGSMGRVYEAIRAVDGRRVALKVLHPRLVRDARSRLNLRREAHALAAASHPHVVAFHELDETRTGRPFLVLDWLDGVTLHELIGRSGPLPPARALRLFAQLASALEVAEPAHAARPGRLRPRGGHVALAPRRRSAHGHVDGGRARSHTVTSRRAPG